MQAFILIFVLGLFGCCLSQDSDEEDMDYLDDGVETPSGKIIGKDTRFYDQPTKSYLGIPYAKPPLGDLRFQKPEPLEPMDGTLVADTMPPACIQYASHYFPWYDAEGGKSEDCLYLNIWSPRFSPATRSLPVIFWIYGGGFTVGSNRILSQNGLGLATIGPAIVVAPNYRVGALGFFSSGTDDAPGNVGIHDLIMALNWVQDNIAAFGGDRDRITIMGQGSGSITVSLFLMSSLTHGLFSRAIMQSGSFVSIPKDPDQYNLDLGQRLAEAVNCTSDNSTLRTDPKTVIDCLRDIKASRLAKVLHSFEPTSTASFLPQYGDDFLPKDPTEDLRRGNFRPVPLLIGNNKDEGSFLLTTQNAEEFGVFGEKDPTVDKEKGAGLIRKMFEQLPDADRIVQQYLGDVDEGDFQEIRRMVYTAAGDYNITCPIAYFAEDYSKGNNTVQYYVFSQQPNVTRWAHWMGSAHHDEVPYVMGHLLAGYKYETFMEYYNGQLGLSYALVKIWANFAKDGSGLKEWKNYSSTHHQYMLLKYNVKKKMRGPGPHLDNCNFLKPYFKHYFNEEVENAIW